MNFISKLLVSIFVLVLVSCDSSDFSADAGPDQTVQIGTDVTLVGTASSPDGTVTAYRWEQTSGVAVELTDSDTASASFTAPTLSSDGSLAFKLIVDDDRGAQTSDKVTIFVTLQPPSNPTNPDLPFPPPSQATKLEIEPNNDLSLADKLALDETISGQVANDTDEDWFEVDFVTGNYQVLFSGEIRVIPFGASWTLSVYDSSNNLKGAIDVSSTTDVTNAKLNVGVAVAGKYYVVVKDAGLFGEATPTQPYAVTVMAL